jgi:uncharacterized membrane protein
MRKNLHWFILVLIFVLSIAITYTASLAQALPVIRLEPKDNTAAIGENFAVNVTVTGITEEKSLYGWECRITFNPNILHAVDATEGPFLKTTGYDTTWLSPNIDNAAGSIRIGALLTPSAQWNGFPPNGAVGTGTLATVTFQVVGQGSTGLEFKECERPHLYGDTELYSVTAGATDLINHTAEGGTFSNAGGFLLPSLSLETIALLIVVAIGCGVVFYFWRKRR